MVTTEAGLQTDLGLDGLDADSEVIADSSDPKVEAEPSKEADPLATLAGRIGTLEQSIARLNALDPAEVKRDLGQLRTLQGQYDRIVATNPLADVDPRLDANEALLTSIADALIASDLTDDRMKSTLSASRSALDTVKGVRAQSRMREELKADILRALPAPVVETNPWQQATVDVFAELAERLPDFDPTSIPLTVWTEGQAKGSPARAAAHVIRWAEGQAQNPAVERTAARRQAAGNGSPSRSGGPGSVEQDRQRLMVDGIPITDAPARKRVREALGLAEE